MKLVLGPYKSECDYSYTSGAYATIELIKTRPRDVRAVYLHSKLREPEPIRSLCAGHGIPVFCDDRVFARVNPKENTYVLGVFGKYTPGLPEDAPHVVLVNPADMGNLGTIVRTLVGLDLRGLAIITPAADIWNPKTVRASMGAVFHIEFEHFESFDAYLAAFPEHWAFPFMLDGELALRPGMIPRRRLFSLVFGNEAGGLDERFRRIGTSVKIPQSPRVDSLNLSAAVAIGAYVFTL